MSDERATKEASKKLAEIIDERFADDDGIWQLPEEDIEAIIEIADAVIEDDPDEADKRDAILIETTALVLQQRILYRDKKGPGSR